MDSTIGESNELYHNIEDKTQRNANKFSEISQIEQNICELKVKFEEKLKTLCKLFGKIGFLNKVELNICNEFKMCKSVASEKSNQRREMITNGCFSGNSSEDKYECDFNDRGKSYKSSKAMKAHKEIHSGVKYWCRWHLCKYETYSKIDVKNVSK